MRSKITVKTIFLNSGYVEDESVSCCIISHGTGFTSINDAIKSLAEIFLSQAPPSTNCCSHATLIKDAKYCAECGTRLSNEMMEYDIEEAVRDFLFSTWEDMGNDLFNAFNEKGWSFQYKDINMKKAWRVDRAPEVLSQMAEDGKLVATMVGSISNE